ncbi:uncharacterized protein LOC126831491 [Patella vulgata]|uniref:uncharacterized protein LOC126831491 n=1 Tax=Patella vulgata TaxID=6465 RepID=UPI002180822C|nr:uncharacterized protein LOC126831491 [Patella vulgata]
MSVKIDLVIKFGGSAITNKDILETTKLESLHWAANLMKVIHDKGLRCVVVHGAGSFGHHQAKAYQVSSGYSQYNNTTQLTDLKKVKLGFCLTRQSVLKLNSILENHLLEENIPVVSLSPFQLWRTKNKDVVKHGCDVIKETLYKSLLPILHGDCVFDETLGCTILSGDTIIETICTEFDVKKVVFITDVPGIYNKPPSLTDAVLLPKIYVESNGDISNNISTSQASHDVTGGIKLKLQTAINIVKQSPSTKLFISQIGSESTQNICCEEITESNSFIGTEIQFVKR